MYNYGWDPYQYMPMMNMPGYFNPSMITMPQQQLECMYPKVYFIVYPVVKKHCDKMDMEYGMMYIPNREQLDNMVECMMKEVSRDVEQAIAEGAREEERQLGFGGRRLLRDLLLILTLRELISRRGGGFGRYPVYPGNYYEGYGEYPMY